MSPVDRDVLERRVSIAARPETVFRFFTDPPRFAGWMGGGQGQASLEPRVGGELRVVFPGGGPTVVGAVTLLDPPRRFAFTWGWEGDETFPAGSSQVDLRLEPTAEGTLLVLRHDGLPNETLRGAHAGGWRVYSALLASAAADEQQREAAPAAIAAWFAAWAERDAVSRRELLGRACAEDIAFRETWACLVGLEELDAHVATSQMISAGVELAARGTPGGSHGWVRFGWEARQGGRVLATGENLGRLDLEGRFSLVVGFRDPAQQPA